MQKVFLTSGSGYIGSAVAAEFLKAGYKVSALARSEESVDYLSRIGVTPIAGNLRNPRDLISALKDADIVVHTAASNDAGFSALDLAFCELVMETLQYTDKTFIYTSGTWTFGNTGSAPAFENSAAAPLPIVAFRVALEKRIQHSANWGMRPIIIRPTVAYGRSENLSGFTESRGLIGQLTAGAYKNGTVQYVGDGNNRIPVVHINDLARLYVLAAERAQPGAVFHATNNEVLTLKEIADLTALAFGIEKGAESWSVNEARKIHGPFVDGYVLDQRIGSVFAQRELGWEAQASTLRQELLRLLPVRELYPSEPAKVA